MILKEDQVYFMTVVSNLFPTEASLIIFNKTIQPSYPHPLDPYRKKSCDLFTTFNAIFKGSEEKKFYSHSFHSKQLYKLSSKCWEPLLEGKSLI